MPTDDEDQITPEGFAEIREELGLTQRQLSAVMGITEKTISRYENGKADIPVIVAKAMRYERYKHKSAKKKRS